MSGYKVDGDLHGTDEFEFTGTDGGGLVTMNERVTGIATALRQKLKNQIQQYGEEPVRELMPLLVEVLETLNSALQDGRDLQDLKEENQQLMKQYETEKDKKSQAQKALIHLEDELISERKDAKDEMQQLKTATRQLKSQLKNYQDRAERMEQRHDQLQTDHAELQEKHRKMVQQYVVLVRSSSKTNTGRSLRAMSEDLARIPLLNISQVGASLNDSFTHVQLSSPTSQVLSSSPKAINSPVSGNGPRPGFCSTKNRKNLQREIEESTKMTVVARRSSGYTVQEATQVGFQFDMDVQETAKVVQSDSEVRSTPIGSSDVETVVKSSLDTMKPGENEVLGQRTNQPGDGQDVSCLVGDMVGIGAEKPEMVDCTDVDRQDEEMFAREKELVAQSLRDQTMPNEDCLYDELGHDSATEVDESAETSRVSIEIQQLVNENRQLQEKGNQISKEHDDLVNKVGILSSERGSLTEEVSSIKSENTSLKEEIKKIKQKLEEEREKNTVNPDEQKRYTRLEMAKILEQRDYYKEKFLELREELDYSEETPLVPPRTKHERSPVFRFFQTLFRKPKGEVTGTEYGSSDSIDPQLYAQIRGSQDKGNLALLDSEDERVHAYGWSLPNGELSKTVLGHSIGVSGRRLPLPVHPVETFSQPIPVPITAGPLMQQDKTLKVTCGVALNSLFRGRLSPESVVIPGANAHIWLCAVSDTASDSKEQAAAKVFVLDANKPTDIINSFDVPGEVLCAISVPPTQVDCTGNPELGPTVWLGTVDGLYIHSAVDNRGQSIRGVSTSSRVLHLLFRRGSVFAGHNNGSVTMFVKQEDGFWDWDNYRTVEPGERKDVPVGAMLNVRDVVWVALDRKVYEINTKSFQVSTHFEAHKTNSVVLMVSMGDGVWMAFKNDCNIRLYHAGTHERIQDLDILPHVQRLLNIPSILQPSSVKVVQMMLADSALWIGTSNGMIMSIPLTLSDEMQLSLLPRAGEVRATIRESKLPCCFSWDVRINLHGHIHGVKALLATPSSSRNSQEPIEDGFVFVDSRKTLVVTAGEGYVDFRAKKGTLASVQPVAKAKSPVRVTSPPECVYVSAWEIGTRAVLEGSKQPV